MNERSIFMEALEKDTPAQRSAYLEEACGSDAPLRQRVEALLASHEQAGSFLGKPVPERLAEQHAAPERAAETPQGSPGGNADESSRAPGSLFTLDEPAVSERPGTVIGPYKLLQQIGEGGMGTVFMAEQQHPVRRKVALKVIKPGMDTRQVIARFEAERQALAMMDHVNIARVLDVGATDSGRPFFVMDLVHGVAITKYCDDNQLTPRQRLELFVPVCQAIQHAHQKGIIHRDVKPSNVMITLYDGKPVPKVIDFGVAKATEQALTERTLFTQYGTIVGTLEYMPPEQAEMSGLGVDTRSDIYALGVLLYELLTGSTPLERPRLREVAYAEVLRLICEEEPPKPSMRLSSSDTLPAIAAARKMEPAKLARLVRGELDWIVMKALEKDRNRRYETANAFAADVLRYLHDEPVQACPPSAAYRFRKFARRNRAALTTAALILVALLAGATISIWQAIRALQVGREALANLLQARTEQQRADANFKKARDVVDKMLTRVGKELADQPRMEKIRRNLLEEALTYYQGFLQEKAADPEVRLETALAYKRVGTIHQMLGRHDLAEQDFGQAIRGFEELAATYPTEPLYEEQLAGCHTDIGHVYRATSRLDRAEQAFQQALDIRQKLADAYPTTPDYQKSLALNYGNLVVVYEATGRLGGAETLCKSGLAILAELTRQHPDVAEYRHHLAQINNDLARLFIGSGRTKDAEAAFLKAVSIHEQLAGENPSASEYQNDLAKHYLNLGQLYVHTSQGEEGQAAYKKSLAIWTRLAREYPDVLDYRHSLATNYLNLGMLHRDNRLWDKAEEDYREAQTICEALTHESPAVGEYQSKLSSCHNNLGNLYKGSGRLDKAEASYLQALKVRERLANSHAEILEYQYHLASVRNNLGAFYLDTNRPALAEAAIKPALQVLERLTREQAAVLDYAIDLGGAYCNMGIATGKKGDTRMAIAWYDKAIQTLQSVLGKEPRQVDARQFLINAHLERAAALVQLGEYARAVQEAEAVAEMRPLSPGTVYDLACFYAVASATTTKDNKLAAPDRRQSIDRYAARAVAQLRRAQDLGFFKDRTNVEHLKADPDLNSLRSRPEFQELTRELEKQLHNRQREEGIGTKKENKD